MSPSATALADSSSSDAIHHFASIRMTVYGSAIFNMTVYSMDDIRSKTLVPFILTTLIRKIPTRLVNFMEQRATFEFTTTNIDESFKITRIVIFTKEIFSSYPGL